MTNALVASMESIDFQRNSTLIKEMGMQYEACIRDPSKNTFNAASEALHKIAKKVTGMNFRFNFARMGGPNAFVIPPQADVASPMRPDELATKVKRFGRPVSEQELFKGTIDTKTGRVSGIYSEIPIDIFVATEFFTMPAMRDITGDHIAAIACHEMGHGFTYLRYLGRFVLSNIVIAEITRQQHEGASDTIVQDVVRVAEQKTGWRLRDLGEINGSTDPLVVQQIVMAGMIESVRSEMGTKFYDLRAFEFASDQFVARHGGALLIVEALDFMYRSYPSYIREYRGRLGNVMSSLTGYLTMFVAALGVVGSIVIGFIPGAMVALLFVIMPLFGAVDDGVYDPIPQRFEAMRRELIASSKADYLSTKQRQEIINQIQTIDGILSGIKDKSRGAFGPEVLFEFVKGVFSGRPAEQKFQRMMENLVNNRLYELSNQLQTRVV